MARPDIAQVISQLNRSTFANVPITLSANGVCTMRYGEHCLESVYQPVVSAVDGTAIGHAARVRLQDQSDARASSWAVFAIAGPDALIVEVDRACRTLHALNYFAAARNSWRLFVRVPPRLLQAVGSGHGKVFEGILGRMGVPTKAIVIELPRHVNEDPDLYCRSLLSYRALGYKVSSECMDPEDPLLLGRYGVVPDVIAVDHRWLPNDAALHRVIERVHERGAQALVTRVESVDQAVHAAGHGADFLQGYYLGVPSQRPRQPNAEGTRWVAVESPWAAPSW